MPTVHSKIIIAFTIALLFRTLDFETYLDEHIASELHNIIWEIFFGILGFPHWSDMGRFFLFTRDSYSGFYFYVQI